MGVLHFMIAYSPLIIAFAVSFMIMFPSNDAFSMFPYAIIKVISNRSFFPKLFIFFTVVCDDVG